MATPEARATGATGERRVEAVEIVAGDGVTLRGQVRAGDDAWIILLSDVGEDEDLDCWAPLSPVLAGRGWSVLAVDPRGHGLSEGVWDGGAAAADVAAVVGHARTGGAVFVGAIAAGGMALAVLRSAAAAGIDALVVLSPPVTAEQALTDLRGRGEAKLIVVGGGDRAMREGGERLCRVAIGWVLLLNLPTAEQGTAMLHGPVARHLTDHVVGFLAEQRLVAGSRSGLLRARANPERGRRSGALPVGGTDGMG
jgi:pimeloyl-ACP methyl ester carboxylesterase